MAITKTTEIGRVEITSIFKHVQVRTATVIKKDGVELTRSFHRHVVAPDADITGESTEVQAICAAVHTQAVKDAYVAQLESLE